MTSLAAAASMAGVAGAPKFSFGQTAGGKTFIKVFMRGGADGLHLFPLFGDLAYYTYRPDIAINPPSSDGESAVDLGSSMRGMNPNLQLMREIWDTGKMMLAPATSFIGNNRSHFDCQRWIGTGARNNLIDGYLNRYMQEVPGSDHPLRGIVAGKTSISTEIGGSLIVPAISQATSFNLTNEDLCNLGCADNRQTLAQLMREISSHEVDLSAVEGRVRDNQLIMIESIDEVQRAGLNYVPVGGLEYSGSDLGRGLKLCAQLLKAEVPLEVAALDWNIGWDTHSDQIATTTNRFTDQTKGYHSALRRGANDFVCFFRDMGGNSQGIPSAMDDIVVLVGSEFGRTKKQNGSVGTDHGEGGAWFAFGGPTSGGVGPDVATIDDTAFSRDWLPTVTSYRDIVGEIMVRHMGMPEATVATIFPGHSFTNLNLFTGGPVA